MTAAVYRNGIPSLSLSQTQSTAPVLEFNCLYTHDIRRKAKRWQDGSLRYHTFNRRVMVYDVPRNFIGDTHWAAGEALQDGDEVMLEKDGVMVQVAEAVGRTETDLTELRNSRKKGSSDRGSSPPAPGPQTPAVRTVAAAASRPLTQLKHRSLNALLGTPKGPVGKTALPTRSPFELTHNDVENEVWQEGRPPKRQRMESPPAWNVTRTTVASKHLDLKLQPLWARTADVAKQRKKAPLPPAQQRLQTHEIIDLRDDEPEPEDSIPGFSSDGLVPPSSPPRGVASATKPAPTARSSSPGFQTQKAPAKSTAAPCEQPDIYELQAAGGRNDADVGDTPGARQLQPPHPPDLTCNGQVERRRAKDPEVDKRPSASRLTEPHRPTSSKSGATLRMAAGAPKKTMLLCQEQLGTKTKRISSTNTEDAADTLIDAACAEIEVRAPKSKSQRQLLEERLARINATQRKADSAQMESAPAQSVTDGSAINADAGQAQEGRVSGLDGGHQAVQMDSALELAKLDQMLEVPTLIDTREETRNVEHAAPQSASEDEVQIAPLTTKRSSPRKEKGVGRREIRVPAQSCFPPPTPPPKQPAAQPDPPPEGAHPVEPQGASRPDEAAPEPPTDYTRPFRRVISETVHMSASKPKRIPGAPMRFTPSQRKRESAAKAAERRDIPAAEAAKPPLAKSAMLANGSRAKKLLQRAVSLNTAASGTAAVMLGRPFQAPKQAVEAKEAAQADVAARADPWSREAFDLFEWRPPGFDEEGWCFKDVADAVDEAARQT